MQRRVFMRLAAMGAVGGLMASTTACAATNTRAPVARAAVPVVTAML